MAPRRAAAVDAVAAQRNAELAAWARTLMAVVGGLLAGVCGLTGLHGFGVYFLTHAATSLALLARLRCAPAAFFADATPATFLASGAFDNLLLFIVMWALGFGTLHVF